MSPAQIERVKSALPITMVAEHYGLKLRKAGHNLVGPCPFHGEKQGSFTVHTVKSLFKCFGCGVGGDSLRLIEMLEHVRFPRALEIGAELAGIPIEHWTREQVRQHQWQRQAALRIAEETALWRDGLLGAVRDIRAVLQPEASGYRQVRAVVKLARLEVKLQGMTADQAVAEYRRCPAAIAARFVATRRRELAAIEAAVRQFLETNEGITEMGVIV